MCFLPNAKPQAQEPLFRGGISKTSKVFFFECETWKIYQITRSRNKLDHDQSHREMLKKLNRSVRYSTGCSPLDSLSDPLSEVSSPYHLKV